MSELVANFLFDLRVDGLRDPTAVDARSPTLSWRVSAVADGWFETAHRVMVATSQEALDRSEPDVWDSGRVESAQLGSARYAGPELTARREYWWKVLAWSGEDIAESKTARWRTGFLARSDWSAEWLAAESDESQKDRELGLQWMWGADSVGGAETRLFRLEFDIDSDAEHGELVLSTSDWWVFIQIAGVWLDGEPIVDNPRWVNAAELAGGEAERLGAPVVPVGALVAGRHVIAIEVRFDVDSANLATRRNAGEPARTTVTPGLTLVLALDLSTGQRERIGAGRLWRTTRGTVPATWRELGFADSEWGEASEIDLGFQPWPARPATLLRTEFELEDEPLSAFLSVTALGCYEANLNGSRVGRGVLAPGRSQFAERVRYQTHEVSTLLRKGGNAIALHVGDGWFTGWDGRFPWAAPPRRVLVQLDVRLADGSSRVISSGPGWTRTESYVRSSSILDGESHDGRVVPAGWSEPRFDDREWEQAKTVPPEPDIVLDADPSAPMVVVEAREPLESIRIDGDTTLFDFGVAFAGWCRIGAKGARGGSVTLRYGEQINEAGRVQPVRANQDSYVLAGLEAGEVFEPHFTIHGFRYVEVVALGCSTHDVTGLVVHADLPVTGSLCSSSPTITGIHAAILQTQRSTLLDQLVDNTVRENRAWIGDAGLFAETAAFNMDLHTYLRRWMVDVRDDQRPDGSFRMVSPHPRFFSSPFNIEGTPPGWGDGPVAMASVAWWHYGTTDIVQENWPAIRRYLDWIHATNPELRRVRLRNLDYGDWMSLEPTSTELLGSAYWAHSLKLAATMAAAIGHQQEAADLTDLLASVKTTFASAYINDLGITGTGSQTEQVLSLAFDLVPSHLRANAAEHLAASIRDRGTSLTTGLHGTRYLLDVLADTGFGSLAFDLILREAEPSWAAMGGTIWESWSATPYGSVNQAGLATIGGFLYRRVAGIAASAPGFASLHIDPLLDERFTHGGGSYDSIKGRISVQWHNTSDRYSIKVATPPNTITSVVLPSCHSGEIIYNGTVSGQPGTGEPLLVSSLGSGVHEFVVTRAD